MAQKKSLRKSDYFALSFGMIIGIGWITALGFWIADAGPLGAKVAFCLGFLFFIPVGFCYSEMAGIYPQMGGPIVYAIKELSLFTSFIAGWMLALTFFFVIIFEALSIAWLMETLWPESMGPMLYSFMGSDIYLGHILYGVGFNTLLCFVSLKGGSSSGTIQKLMTAILIIIVTVLVVAALFKGNLDNLSPVFVKSEGGSIWPGIIAVFGSVPFFLSGFEAIAQGISERDKSVSAKAIANILILSIACAALFYVAIIISASVVAPRDILIGEELAAAKAFEIGLGSTTLMKVGLIGGLLGLLSTWNAAIFVFVMAMLALGKTQMIWPGFAKTNKNGISVYSITITIVLVAFGVLLGKNAIIPLINSSSTAVGILFFIVSLSLIYSRKNRPLSPRPYKAPGGLALPIIGCLASLYTVVLTIIDPYTPGEGISLEWWLFGGWMLVGLILWFVGINSRKKIGMDKEQVISILENKTFE
ncbi:MAG: APC family permease [Ekhidna sp.]|nr:APC family permease [Ekhidna sp.]